MLCIFTKYCRDPTELCIKASRMLEKYEDTGIEPYRIFEILYKRSGFTEDEMKVLKKYRDNAKALISDIDELFRYRATNLAPEECIALAEDELRRNGAIIDRKRAAK